MDKIVSYITKNLVSVIGISILTGTTLTTSALGVMKVANNFEKTKVEVPEVKEMEPTIAPTTIPTPGTSTSGGTNTIIPHPKASSLLPTLGLPVPTTPPQSQASASNAQCVITLFGKQYDVSRLRNTHSGGNIFTCGTDMTAVYQGRHGSDLSRMQQYLIAPEGTTSSNTNSGNASNNSGNTGTSSSGSSSSSDTEIHKEEERENEKEIHDEDHKEEEKEHLESLIHALQLVVS